MGRLILQILHIFKEDNYEDSWPMISREAARAVIMKDDRIALVHSITGGFYKFPGGGIEKGETHLDALVRETLEEVGLRIIPASVRELGMIQELRKNWDKYEIFDQRSYYYYADVENTLTNQSLDDYEMELGFELVWVELETAYSTNMGLIKSSVEKFLPREAFVLKYLMEHREK
jgi:8-oxo-dGTP pyrophosphatase MutT (NUDIX family)